MTPLAQDWEKKHREYQRYFLYTILLGIPDAQTYNVNIDFDDSFRACGLKAKRRKYPIPAAWGW